MQCCRWLAAQPLVLLGTNSSLFSLQSPFEKKQAPIKKKKKKLRPPTPSSDEKLRVCESVWTHLCAEIIAHLRTFKPRDCIPAPDANGRGVMKTNTRAASPPPNTRRSRWQHPGIFRFKKKKKKRKQLRFYMTRGDASARVSLTCALFQRRASRQLFSSCLFLRNTLLSALCMPS